MLYYPVYALYHYYPEAFWLRTAFTAVLLISGIVGILLLHKKGKVIKQHPGWAIALWVYTIFLLYITLIGRYSFDDNRSRLIPFESYRDYAATGNLSELRGIIGNILMFIPFSFICAEVCKDKKPVMTSIITGIILTLTIETLQYITHTGTFEVDDMIHNVVGSIMGVLIWLIPNKIKKQTDRIGL